MKEVQNVKATQELKVECGLNQTTVLVLSFCFLAVHNNGRSKAGSQTPQILRPLGHLNEHSRISYSHFGLAAIARKSVGATQINFFQARTVQCALHRSALML